MKGRQRWSLATGAILASALAAPAAAQVTVQQRQPCESNALCHEVILDIQLPGERSAEITLRFERTFDLSTSSLAVTAKEVTDADLLGRLPAGTFVNRRLPLLVTIAPRPGFRFAGRLHIELRTDAIDFVGERPTERLFMARSGSRALADITQSVGFGSYRLYADTGDFGELLVVSDLRPTSRIALEKYRQLQADIDAAPANQLDAAARAELTTKLEQSRSAFLAGDRRTALRLLDELDARVALGTGGGINDRWDASTGKISQAGILRGDLAAAHLSVELATRPRSQSTASIVRRLVTPAGRSVEVIVSFPNEVGELAEALDVSARDVDPGDPALLARLPAGVSLPARFPVVVHVGPLASRTAMFRGQVEVELRTRDLDFTAGGSLRLFSAPDGGTIDDLGDGGAFVEVTESFGVGSVRVRAAKGGFSDFLIGRDERSPDQVIDGKLDALDQAVAALADVVSSETQAQLSDRLAEARGFVDARRYRQAIESLDAFVAAVEAASGTEAGDVPDLFRAGDARINRAGELIAGARSLQLSLTLRRPRVVVAP